MSPLVKYDITRLMGVAVIFFVFSMTLLRVAGLEILKPEEFTQLLQLAGVLLGGHEVARFHQRRSGNNGDNGGEQ